MIHRSQLPGDGSLCATPRCCSCYEASLDECAAGDPLPTAVSVPGVGVLRASTIIGPVDQRRPAASCWEDRRVGQWSGRDGAVVLCQVLVAHLLVYQVDQQVGCGGQRAVGVGDQEGGGGGKFRSWHEG